MDTDAPAAAPPEGDVAAPTEAAPVVRTFALAPSVWAEEEDEPITKERQRQYDELAEKYKSRAERFGTEARDPHTQVRGIFVLRKHSTVASDQTDALVRSVNFPPGRPARQWRRLKTAAESSGADAEAPRGSAEEAPRLRHRL